MYLPIALSLAVQWGRIDRVPKIGLAKGERQRERVLTDEEATRYLGASGCGAFTLARIAGHSPIQMTMRHCHPQADAIERAFLQMANRQEAVSNGGQRKKNGWPERREPSGDNTNEEKGLVGAPGVARTPDLQIRSLLFKEFLKVTTDYTKVIQLDKSICYI